MPNSAKNHTETTPVKKTDRNSSASSKYSNSASIMPPSPYYSNNDTHLNGLDWFSNYQDLQTQESYIDMLTTSGEDWLDSYSFTIDEKNNNKTTKKKQRTTFIAPTSQPERQPVMVRKSKSLRENSKYKLRSPPPPKTRKSGFNEDMPSLPAEKRHSMQYNKKKPFVRSKNSDESLLPENHPRKTVSLSTVNHYRRSQNVTSVLSDYQGYSRQNKHRSFTYSPPPPSFTDSSNPIKVPAVPPIPPMPKILPSSSSTKLKKKKSDLSSHSNSSRPTSNTSANSYYKLNEPIPNVHDISNLQKELESIITASPSLDSSATNLTTSNYALNLTNDLAQIEKDIKALELERERHNTKQKSHEELPLRTIGRKRGKTLPGSLATPPPIPAITLPPMILNPIQMTIPNNIQKKQQKASNIKLQPSTSTTTTRTNKLKIPSLTSLDVNSEIHEDHSPSIVSGISLTNLKSLEKRNKYKSYIPTPSHSTEKEKVKRAASYKQPNYLTGENLNTTVESPRVINNPNHHARKKSLTPEDNGGRSPKSVQTTLKYYAPYLSAYERQIEIHDFKHIYFVGPHAKKQGNAASDAFNFGYDDERGDYKIVIQDHLAYRYEVIEVLGRGSFGQVVKCFDHKTSQMVAIKLIRNKKRFHAQAIIEVNILKKLVAWDPDDHYNTIKMTDHFYFRNHLCIAFECLCMNLYEFIKSNHFQGFSVGLIKRITYQIIQTLLLLAEHDVIHCDLKPENIMLKHPGKSSIKVIDFGSSCLESERVYTYIQSRFYRSPEVILGISYHKAIDMWSLGCIIAELYTGTPIFPGENEQEQLGCIMEVMGIPDRHIIEKCSRRKLFFDSLGNPRIVANSKGKKRIPGTKSLFQVLKCHDVAFIDFIERCLRWDPARRMTPREALQHEWIVGSNSFPVTPNSMTFLTSPAVASAYN